MRYAIIDNSTLTAVQRLLGQIPVVNRLCIDGDITAFENLIQAILFYDNLFYIDDYKQQFRESRRDTFQFITPIATQDFPYDSFVNASSEAVKDLMLNVQGGRIDQNEFGKLLKSLRMHVTFTWDMRSSDFFLTMKMLKGIDDLEADKYSALMDMIFLELSANKETIAVDQNRRFCKLVGSDGNPIPKIHEDGSKKFEVTKQIYAFSSSLNWLSLRTAFYSLIGGRYQADIFLHPIRSAFQLSFAERLGLPGATFKPIIDRLNAEARLTLQEIRKNTDSIVVDMRLPLFSAWLASKVKGPSEIIQEAFALRMEKPFLDARRHLMELEDLAANGSRLDFVREANRLVLAIQNLSDVLRQTYGVKTRNGVSITPLVFLTNLVAKLKGLPSIPNVPIKIPMPDRILEIGTKSGFKGVYRSVTQDLIAVERLGHLHDVLLSQVQFDKDASELYPKTEELRYLGKRSDWKIPM